MHTTNGYLPRSGHSKCKPASASKRATCLDRGLFIPQRTNEWCAHNAILVGASPSRHLLSTVPNEPSIIPRILNMAGGLPAVSLGFLNSSHWATVHSPWKRNINELANYRKPTSRRRPRSVTRASSSGDRPGPKRRNQNNNDEEGDEDPELSRRVFLAGVAATTTVTALAGYRFVIGEDIESRVRLRLSHRFPSLFPRESTPEERRGPLDAKFAQRYFDAVRVVSSEMRLLPDRDLLAEEAAVRGRALPLFFDDEPERRTVADPAWLNFLLYARLHVIATRTSPRQRLDFADRLARRTMRELRARPVPLAVDEARLRAETWLGGVRGLLQELVGLGWISGFRVEEFDGEPGSAWQDERRASLTVFALDPVTMQAAQLIGEEQYEEISPKVSGWISAYLKDSGISKVSFEDYYLDDAYRPDPEQFKPSQLATQFDLAL